jgi:hypothetical protein
MTFVIAMPGPPLPEMGSAAAMPARDALPSLPHLTRLLGAARRLPRTPDWRAGALAALNAERAVQWPAAAVAARGLPGLAAGMPLCFAAPLHVVAGISRVHLPPEGILAPDAVEREAWRVEFNREFGDARSHLHAVPGGWLLASPGAAAARDAAPSGLLGAALERRPAQDAAERQLRRLGTEVEMWLLDHPLNRQREARRQPPVNCFWFWDGASATDLPPLAQPPRTIHGPASPDAWLAGLARHAGLERVEMADGWDTVKDQQQGLVVPAADVAAAARAQWEGLEARWFGPMWRALRAGELRALRLQIGATAWQLPDTSPLRWLRRVRPITWWQALQA